MRYIGCPECIADNFGRFFFRDWAIAWLIRLVVAADGVAAGGVLTELLDLAALARRSRRSSWS